MAETRVHGDLQHARGVDVETARKARIVVGVKEEILGHLPPYDAIESLLASGDLTEADVSCEITDILLGRERQRVR